MDSPWALTVEDSLRQAIGFVPVRPSADATTTDPRPICPTSDAFAVLHLLPSAPSEPIAIAYRAVAKLFHPNRGGEQIQQVNAAYTLLKQRRAAS